MSNLEISCSRTAPLLKCLVTGSAFLILVAITLVFPLNGFTQILRLKRLTDLVRPDSVEIGKKAPDVEMYDRNDAGIRLSSLFGKYLLINFWSEGVVASMLELPYWERARQKFKRRNIDFVRISLEKDKGAWIRYYDQHHLQGIQLYGDPYKAPLSYYLLKSRNIKGKDLLSYTLPRYYLIDQKGVILDNDIAVKPSDTLNFDRFISKLPGL